MNSINTNYYRVIPRDLFNEGKLLTELGFLSLAILDNKDGIENILTIELTEEDYGFVIAQDETNGSLFVSNLRVQSVKYFTVCEFYIPLNCRDKNALRFRCELFDIEGVVFNGADFSNDFKSLLKQLS